MLALVAFALYACRGSGSVYEQGPATGVRQPTAAWAVHFSPKGGCTDAIVAQIASAKTTIHVQSYSFTSAPIAGALADAKLRGLDVQIIVDRSDVDDAASPTTKLDVLLDAHVPVWNDAKHAIAHNKIMIFDGESVETGSFNYTKQAESSNAENCLFLTSPALAAVYEHNWQTHLAHSTRVSP